ncbi:MAG TPA: DUF4157 domain-containing protein [Pyrinomonadaceae bacterium]|nr:DUF4157 domain-containing protein [Pyrinomonadaceae bacterium]
MLTFASSQNARTADVKSDFLRPHSAPLVSARPLIQRKAGCTCGGECPKCNGHSELQAKLPVSTPGDQYEVEADRVASQIMNMQSPQGVQSMASQVQRKCSKCEDEEKSVMRAAAGAAPLTASANIVPAGGGQSLPSDALSFFGSRFGYDFSGVRIHADTRAHEAARSVNAEAFTLGENVVFEAGRYAPHSDAGRRLLAHELTHVVQQNGGLNNSRLQVQRWASPMVQRQQATCSIDIIQAAKVLSGDRSAALKVLDCCQKGLSPLPEGCTSDLIAAAEKILGKGKGSGGKANCDGLPGFFPAGSSDLLGQCCTGFEDARNCCPPERISRNDPAPRCCTRDETVEDGHCVKIPPVNLTCPPGQSMTIFGTCVKDKPPDTPPDKPPTPPPAPFTTVQNVVIEFNKDAPQSWHTFKTSVTPDGQKHFDELVALLTAQPDAKVQLEAHASSEKPKGQPDYNKKLTDRRVKIVANELKKKKVDPARVSNPPTEPIPSSCEEIAAGQLSCGDTSASPTAESSDRKVVAEVFTVPK